jgi:hypothetical protein
MGSSISAPGAPFARLTIRKANQNLGRMKWYKKERLTMDQLKAKPEILSAPIAHPNVEKAKIDP